MAGEKAQKEQLTDYNRPWNLEDEQELYILRRDGHPFSSIGAVLRRTADACRGKYNRTIWEKKPFYGKLDALKSKMGDQAKDALREKMIASGEIKANRYALQSEVFADAIVSAIRVLPTAKPKQYKPSDKTDKHKSEDVGLMLSDMHIGHSHALKETGGISGYSCDIFLQRAEILKNRVADIVELHSQLYELPNLHIFCLGDIVAGMNNVGQWSHTFIETDIMNQWSLGVKSICDMIYYWLGIFEDIYFYGIAGNHARIAQKGIEKDTANWDALTYKFIEQTFDKNPRVHFNVPDTWWVQVEVKSHKFLLVHGDDIKGRSSIRGLERFMEKWATIINSVPNYTLAGHFHSSAELTTPQGRVFVNGAFLGPDVYSLKTIHASARPEQKMFGIHNKRGVTWVYNIDLSEDK